MSAVDVAGWSAAVLMLLTFACRELRSLRTIALAASVCFIVYGALADLAPVLALHLMLVPIHVRRLVDACRDHDAQQLRASPAALPADRIAPPLNGGDSTSSGSAA